jgi:hypothetical protein
MTKATNIINYYSYKEMLINGNPQFENFRKDELINFCEIAKEIIQNQKKEILEEITNFCNECPSKECCSENECVLYKIEKIINGN